MTLIETYPRRKDQQKLVDVVDRMFHQMGPHKPLKPLCAHTRFAPPGDNWWDIWTDGPIYDLAWKATARVMERVTTRHVIDHAWLFGVADEETFGFVTEPYLDADGAQAVAKATLDVVAPWNVLIHCFDASLSSWNPGSCQPIMVTFERGGHRHALHQALKYLLAEGVL